jgi:diguanylate cyclase (GGDEF)-like protein
MNVKGDLLIVDKTSDKLHVLFTELIEQGYKVRCLTSGAMALAAARADHPDLILLANKITDMDGDQICRHLKEDPTTQDIPVILLSTLGTTLNMVKTLVASGIDFISQPFQVDEVLIRIEHQLALHAAKAEVGRLKTELDCQVQQLNAQLTAAHVALQESKDRFHYDALHDALTGLANRVLLMDRMDCALKRAQRHSDYQFGILLLDLDRFKVLNDSLGHLIGDAFLVEVARRLEVSVREIDTVARLGGDEFAIMLDDLEDLDEAIQVAERIEANFRKPFQLEGTRVCATTSIGIAMSTAKYEHAGEILRDADLAMYRAKEQGKARYVVFDPVMHTQAQTRLQLEYELRHALDRQEFRVYYQPIVALDTLQLIGFEALVRWQHPERGLVNPGEFIPLAEETGLIIPISQWVLQEACRQVQDYQQLHPPTAAPLEISVNFSGQQFQEPALLQHIDQVLTQTGFEGHLLRLELTESILIDDADVATRMFAQINARKIKLCIDDFGTGYSSLSYLHRFPVDTLKIDRSFIHRISHKSKGLGIVEAIITLAHQLNIKVTAEGIETSQQLIKLQSLGCDFGQGFWFSKPMGYEDVRRSMQQLDSTYLLSRP